MSKGKIRLNLARLREENTLSGFDFVKAVDHWEGNRAKIPHVSCYSPSAWKQLYQVHIGLTYLHSEGIVHGDLHGVSQWFDNRIYGF